MRQHFALVFNQRAGTIRPVLLDRVLTLLRNAGARVVPIEAASAEEATAEVRKLALAAAVDAFIAAGGDGTIRAVAAGVADTGIPVGFIPLGTGNVMKHEIGLSSRPSAIAETLLHGALLPARCGLVNGAPFFLMVGAGFDGRIITALSHRTKRLLGRAAYSIPVTRALIKGAEPVRVEVDGETYTASWAIITNATRYGGSFVLTEATQVGAQGLMAILVTGQSRRALLTAGLALALGRLGDPRRCPEGVIVKPARQVRITAVSAVPLQVDGDEAGTTPADISALGPQVSFIVPAAYLTGLTKRHTNRIASQV